MRLDPGGYRCSGVREYRVRWRGWGPAHDTWEKSMDLDSGKRKEYLRWRKEEREGGGGENEDEKKAEAAEAGGGEEHGRGTNSGPWR